MMAFDSSRFECHAARPNDKRRLNFHLAFCQPLHKKHLYLLIRLRKEYNSHMDSIYMILLSFSHSFYPFLLYCLTKDGFFFFKKKQLSRFKEF